MNRKTYLALWALLAAGCSRDLSTPPEDPVDLVGPVLSNVTASREYAGAGQTIVVTFDSNEALPPSVDVSAPNPG